MHVKVLLVEDDPKDAELTLASLADEHAGLRFEVSSVSTLEEARTRLLDRFFDVILLDLGLPDGDGLDALARVADIARGVPVVVLSRTQDDLLAVQAVRHGAQDYLIKGRSDRPRLVRAIRFALERKKSEERITHMAHYDLLTNVPNRRLLSDRLDLALARARRDGELVAVCFLDLDQFRWVNDTLGHAAGDLLLQEAAHRLKANVRESDTVARLGGDEFAVVLSGPARAEDAACFARKILDSLAAPFIVEGHEVRVTASMGISIYPDDGLDAGTLLNHADLAMYGARQSGRGEYRFYSPEVNARATERLRLATELRRALRRGELVLHYLPTMSVRNGRTIGVEALVRWDRPVHGLLAPAEFVPLAEETGLIEGLEEWVIGEACRQARAWSANGTGGLRVTVNLSACGLGREGLRETVGSAIRSSGIAPGDLELDLNEGGLVRSGESGRRVLEKLRGTGVRIAIDDFGTASSLPHLRRFPVTALKIDGTLMKNVTSHSGDAVIHQALISMAHGLGLEVVAEGVEREEHLTFLRHHECDYAQGFFIGHPATAVEMSARLAAERADARASSGGAARAASGDEKPSTPREAGPAAPRKEGLV